MDKKTENFLNSIFQSAQIAARLKSHNRNQNPKQVLSTNWMK